MAIFSYNPFAESVRVTYICPHCNKAITEDLIVPTPDLLAETHHDSINCDTIDIPCKNCGEETQITLFTGIYGGEGDIPNVDKILDVLEEYPEDEELFYGGQSYEDSLNNTTIILERIINFDTKSQNYLFKLLYANVITQMEAFLSDTLKKEVLKTIESKRNFVEKYSNFKSQKFTTSEVFKIYSDIDNIIRETLDNIIYHNLGKIKSIYKDILDINIGDIQSLSKAVIKRHDIVHRNGKDKKGEDIIITKMDILTLSNEVSSFISNIESQIRNRDPYLQASGLPF